MNRPLIPLLPALVAGAFALAPDLVLNAAHAQRPIDPNPGAVVGRVNTMDVYAVKFLCGEFDVAGAATRPPGSAEGPVKRGNYQTAINVHNPNGVPVRFRKKAVLLFEGTEPVLNPDPADMERPRPPGPRVPARLDPDWGLEIDCPDIRQVLLQQPPVPGAVPPFIKGWVVIEAPVALIPQNPQFSDAAVVARRAPLDVVVVYTAHGFTGTGLTPPPPPGTPPLPTPSEGFTIDVERVLPTEAIGFVPAVPGFDQP